MWPLSLWTSAAAHKQDCINARARREARMAALAPVYAAALTSEEAAVHDLSLGELVAQSASGGLTRGVIVGAYGKKAWAAQRRSNCLSEVLVAEAVDTPVDAGGLDEKRVPSLLNVPISIKDVFDYAPYPSTVSYSARLAQPSARDSGIVTILKRAGAAIHCKSAVPTGLFGLETLSDAFGYTSNPYGDAARGPGSYGGGLGAAEGVRAGSVEKDEDGAAGVSVEGEARVKGVWSAGASGGGGAVLLAHGGAVVDVGTDVGGSVRIPASFTGIYGLKPSHGRLPSLGAHSNMPGHEGVPIVTGAMARRLGDLREFVERVVGEEPWAVDQSCLPIPWRPTSFDNKKLRFGILWTDGAIPPTPACTRALREAADALRKAGHEVVDFEGPEMDNALGLCYELVFGDGGEQIISPLRRTEFIEPAVRGTHVLMHLPRFVRTLLAYLAARAGDALGAAILRRLNISGIVRERALVVERDRLRQLWMDAWVGRGVDLVLTVVHPLPGLPRGETARVTLNTSSYCILWNLLDYPAGALPVTHVSPTVDALPPAFWKSDEGHGLVGAAKGTWGVYDAEKMSGLPVGIQVVGRRFQEERVLEGMRVVEEAIRDAVKRAGNGV